MIRTVFCGRNKILVPDGWTTLRWSGITYRVVGPEVQFWSPTRIAWVPSLLLTTSAPKGRDA